MAYFKDISISFKGDLGRRRNHVKAIKWPGAVWGTLLDLSFQNALAAFTDCNIKSVSDRYHIPGDLAAPGVGANIDKTLVIRVRNITKQEVQTLTVPAPKASKLEDYPGGQRLANDEIENFMDILSDYMSDDFTFLYSFVEQRR